MEKKLGGEDDSRDLASWDWRSQWRLGERRRYWRLTRGGVAMTLETKQAGIADIAGDLVAGEWK